MSSGRVRKVADRIHVIVAEMLERRIKDARLGFVTVTDVRVTGDTQHASIFYTVLGDDEQRAASGAALESAKGLIRSEVGKQLGMRHTPTLEFILDALPESARHIDDLLAQARQSDAEVAAAAASASYAGEADPYRRPADDIDADDADDADDGRRGERLGLSLQAPEGLLVVDKPEEWTSHDVVARVRRLAGTRKVGHAGTLDPMATGVLLIGVGRATRLLGHLALADKSYDATIRLGRATTTDDAEGEVLTTADASALTRDEVDRAAEPLRGDILQVPSKVSAIKIDGQRAYKRVRSGEDVTIPARPVHVERLDLADVRLVGEFLDVDVQVDCSTGTYIRALARDLGEALGVGGHLTKLRRTRVGSVDVQQAHGLAELAELASEDLPYLTLDEAARMFFDWHVVEDDHVAAVRNGRAVHVRLRPSTTDKASGPVAVLAPDGTFLALYEQHGPVAQAVAVFAPA